MPTEAEYPSMPTDPNVSQLNPIYILSHDFCKINFNPTLPLSFSKTSPAKFYRHLHWLTCSSSWQSTLTILTNNVKLWYSTEKENFVTCTCFLFCKECLINNSFLQVTMLSQSRGCMYVCMHVCMYVCMHAWMYVRIYVCMYVCMHACMYVCMYACMYVCMHACMHAYLHVCMHVCMYGWMYTHTHTRRHACTHAHTPGQWIPWILTTHQSTQNIILHSESCQLRRATTSHGIALGQI
jgi:hypothetical protein